MKELIFLVLFLFISVSAIEEDPKIRNETKAALVKDLQAHLDYMLTVVPKENKTVEDFLLGQEKISGDFERSWYSKKESITKFLQNERKVQEWLKTWRSGELEETVDFFINAAENYKTWATSLGINGSELMKKSYELLFDQDFKLANQEGRLKAVYEVLNKLDSYYNVCEE